MRNTERFSRFNQSQRHALDAKRNLAVRANAGSGKTAVLIERIGQILARSWADFELGQAASPLAITAIVGITFTRKAAAQLEEELHRSFHDMARQAGDTRERDYWIDQVETLPRAMIGTIDAFCSSVLREFGLTEKAGYSRAAGLIEPDFEILSDYDELQVKAEAIDRVLDRLTSLPPGSGSGSEQAQAEACRWWATEEGFDVLVRHLVKLLGHAVEPKILIAAHSNLPSASQRVRDAWQFLPAVRKLSDDRRELGGLLRSLNQTSSSVRNPGRHLTALCDGIPDILRRLENLTEDDIEPVLCWLREQFFTQQGKRWSQGFAKVKSVTDSIQDTWESLLQSYKFDRDGELRALEAADRLVLLLGPVYDEYLRLCREAGRFDFLTVARSTCDLLRSVPDVGEQLRSRYRYLLVDEFQDTNGLQWEILAHLVQKPDGTLDRDRLFIVGDPQQSIYRFRQADVTVFGQVLAQICQANASYGSTALPTHYDDHLVEGGQTRSSNEDQRLGKTPLRENYRSLTPLPLHLLNRVFRQVFGVTPPTTAFEVAYQDLEPGVNSKACGEVRYVHVQPPSNPDDANQDGMHQDDADQDVDSDERTLNESQVAAVVDQLLDLRGKPRHTAREGESPTIELRDMAILLPSRDVVLNNLEKELTRRRVPYVVTKGIGFWQRQEVRDVVSLTTALADRGDDLALFAVLRGPLCQLSDTNIVFLSQLGRGRIGRGLRLIAAMDDTLAFAANLDDDERAYCEQQRSRVAPQVLAALVKAWQSFPAEARARSRQTHALIERWRRRVDRMAHADLLQQALEETGAYAIYAAESDSDLVLANLRRLFDTIRALETDSTAVLTRLARRLRDLVEDSYREEQATPDPGRDAVQIMTIHAAKGLEFAVTAIMKMERVLNKGWPPMLLVAGTEPLLASDAPHFAPVPPGTVVVAVRHPLRPRETFTPRLLEALRKLENDQDLAESRRLFFVAATRAREHLILAGQEPKKDGERWQKWFEDALGINATHKAAGEWQDGDLKIRIVTRPLPSVPLESAPAGVATIRTALRPVREASLAPTIPVTTLGLMLDLRRANAREYRLKYEAHVLPHVDRVSDTFPADKPGDQAETLGKAIGTLVHRMFEIKGHLLDPAERRRLLEAMAANLLAARAESNAAPGPPAGVAAVVAGVTGVLRKLDDGSSGSAAVRQLLEAAGPAEVDFLLQLGPWYVTGRFDKLLQVASGHEIVDWKTDSDGAIDDIAQRHESQMKLYALALLRTGTAAVTNGKVRVHLAMLHFPAVKTLEFAVAELEKLADDVLAANSLPS